LSVSAPASAPSGGTPPVVEALYAALINFANANGFQIGTGAARYAAQIAANNVQRRSFNDAARQAGVQTAIANLPQVAAQVRALTAETSFPDENSVRTIMRSKLCDCPWPWGDGP
jgi:hypothetical protein